MRRFICFLLAMVFVSISCNSYASDSVMLKKIDSFSIIIDQSGSMYMKDEQYNKTKMELAKEAVCNIITYIPDLNYNGSVYLASEDIKLVETNFDNNELIASLNKISNENEIFGRFTNLSSSLISQKDINLNSRKDVIIYVTDGDWNRGEDPSLVLNSLYNEKNCDVHIVSFADTEEGNNTIKSMKALNENSIVVNGTSLLDKEVSEDFVNTVFYGYYTPIEVLFDFDKSKIRSKELQKLDEVKRTDLLFDKIVVNGYTCTIGTESYNQKLSERRANEVAKYLNTEFYSGFGESTIYQEKKLNRRAEIILK